MRRAVTRGLVLACAALGSWAPAVRAEPVLGVDAAASLPRGAYGRSVGDGGALGVWGGYGVGLTDWLWLGGVLEPRFSVFSGDRRVSSETSASFSFTGGPRLTARLDHVELFFAGMGGLYTDISGPFGGGSAGGWNVGGGLQYYLVPFATSLGVLARYDSSGLQAAPTGDASRAVLSFGLTVQRRFLEPPPRVP
jgi:hypothetical protein